MSLSMFRIGALVATATLICSPASAQATGEALVNGLLNTTETSIREAGLRIELLSEVRFSLNADDVDAKVVQLDRGQSYVFTGACDEDCTDIDLAVGAPDDSVVTRDVLDDDSPMVDFTAQVSGQYQIVISMVGCDVEPCLAGVRLYRIR